MKRLTVLALALALTLSLSGCLDDAPDALSAPPAAASGGESGMSAPESDFSVHFIDVGQADSILILSEGEAMLIDAGNNDDGETVAAYLEAQGVGRLKYAVGTHAHEDHIGGMDYVLDNIAADELLLSTVTAETDCYEDMLYSAERAGTPVGYPEAGEKLTLGGCSVEVVGPVREYEDKNDSSLVLELTYEDYSFLFTGDASEVSEHDMLEAGTLEDIDVLKVGHHGSYSSSSYVFLREVMPEYAVICVGAGNDYGHPHEDALSRLSDCGAEVYRTDEQGSVVVTVGEEGLEFSTLKDAAPHTPTETDREIESVYIGNKNSKVFHTEDCSSLPKESNRVYFGSYKEAIDAGYTPCGGCKP